MVLSAIEVKAIRGGKNPFELEFTSNCAEEVGELVPIPTCAFIEEQRSPKTKTTRSFKFVEFFKVLYMVYDIFKR